jgi:hypothetical protein
VAATIAAVRTLLSGITGDSTTLAAATLDTPGITQLFAEFLPAAGLVIEAPVPDATALTLGGRATVGSASLVPVVVTFLTDASGTLLAGLTIRFRLANFAFSAPWAASFDGAALTAFGLAEPCLVLATEAATDDGAPQAAIEGTKSIQTSTGHANAVLTATIPSAALVEEGLASNYVFTADLTGVTLGNPAALAQFATGASFDLPSDLPLADSIELTRIVLVADPARGRIVSFSATVRSGKGVSLLSGIEIEYFWFSFTVLGLGGFPQVYAVAGTTLDLYGHEIDITLSVPELYFEGDLHADEPVPLKPFVEKFMLASMVPDNFRLSVLDFGMALKEPHSFALSIEVDDLWQVPIGSLTLSVDAVRVDVVGDGAESRALAINGRITFAKSALYLSFSRPLGGAHWTVAGGTVDSRAIVLPDGSSIGGIDVCALIADLGTHFHITVPRPIASFVLAGLAISFETGTDEFTFVCTGRFTVEDTPLALKLAVDIKPATGSGYDAKFSGRLTVGEYEFSVFFDHEDTQSDTFVAAYSHSGAAVMVDLRAFLGNISSTVAGVIPEGIEIGLHDLKLLFRRQASGSPSTPTTQWAVNLDLDTQISLSNLPTVGTMLPVGETLAITKLQVGYSNLPLLAAEVGALNALMADNPGIVPFVPSAGGVSFGADLQLGSDIKHFELGVPPPKASAPPVPALDRLPSGGASRLAQAVGSAAADPIKWFDINRQFGVFSFQRVGVGYSDNTLLFSLDASVALGPLAFSMQALTVGSSLKAFDPVFSLSGLALSFNRPPIEIGGAFLRTTETVGDTTVTAYYGELMVGIASFSLKAVGGWVPKTHSFFLYLSIGVPLGGTPFLFVTGLAGGFGINTSLTLPSIDNVGKYILLPGIAPPEQSTPAETIKSVLDQLRTTVVPAAGEYWVAAGIRLTSFEMIDSQVVVSVEFGVEVQVGVVGMVTMNFPTGAGADAVAHVEIDLIASFTPSTGLLSCEGRLSQQSFLFGGFIKLTGGFACRTWFSAGSGDPDNDHRGDFVVSLGGYHPAFDRPANYPVVPRLGMSFALGPLKVVGASYFALTPHAFMAGLRLAATFEAGPIKAWFDAGVDFLIEWAPFHYEAGAYVDFGCSVDLGLFTLTLHIGADLEIWGPAFGGTAEIDLVIVSFTIAFGAPRSAPAPIGWATLADKFLPASTQQAAAQPRAERRLATPVLAAVASSSAPAAPNVVTADVPVGKLKSNVIDADGQPLDWIVDANHFRIVTSSIIPANHADWTVAADGSVDSLPNDRSVFHAGLPAPGPDATTVSPMTEHVSATAVPTDMYLWLEPGGPAVGPVWTETLHVAPMDQRDVAIHHVVKLCQLLDDGGKSYVTEVAVRPILTRSNTALWGDKPGRTKTGDAPPAGAGANAPRLIDATLTGLEISPLPRHPDAVSAVPLRDLIYQQDSHTEFSYQTPTTDTVFTVASTLSHKDETLTIDIGCAAVEHLVNNGYRLSSLTDAWVASRRAAVLDELRSLGFGTAAGSAVDLTAMAATALTDWPTVACMGAAA